ncbi:MAG: YqeG family HAD IIIA-type phosphatase [Clostridiaceae bacterium]|jgi:HAD superfamily phosphatase (TIGR01668 family)|nr:YqeG family HAD IIIA-type phosphatase [Clostridiaceae bacterium]
MTLCLGRYLKPDTYCANLDDLDFPAFFEDGYRLVLLDVDNTLARHGSFAADEYARRAIDRAQQAGLACRIVSNAGKKRIHAYAATLGLPYVAWARKPSTRGIREACRIESIEPEATIMIGDQILTDIVSAHRAGCLAVLVRPRYNQEALHVRLKRFFERIVLAAYKLKTGKQRRKKRS